MKAKIITSLCVLAIVITAAAAVALNNQQATEVSLKKDFTCMAAKSKRTTSVREDKTSAGADTTKDWSLKVEGTGYGIMLKAKKTVPSAGYEWSVGKVGVSHGKLNVVFNISAPAEAGKMAATVISELNIALPLYLKDNVQNIGVRFFDKSHRPMSMEYKCEAK